MNPNHDIDKSTQDFLNKKYLGVVVDTQDPQKEGRCRVQVYGVYDGIPVEDLPWAFPKAKSTIFGEDGKSGAISIPKKNAIVIVEFDNGDIMSPEFHGIQELEDGIKDELGKTGEYQGSHFLLFDGDEELKIWFTAEKGITMQLKGSRINIGQNKAITIEHDESQSIIELEGGTVRINTDSQINMSAGTSIKASSEQVHVDGKFTQVGHNSLKGPGVLGDKLFMLLTVMATAIDTKYPTTPGYVQNFVETFKAIALSDTVTISK